MEKWSAYCEQTTSTNVYVAEEQEKETKVLLWNKKSSQDATGDTRVLFQVAFCFFLHVQLFSSDLMPL